MKLNSAQLKAVSEFLNTVAAAWFIGGIITLLFADSTQIGPFLVISLAGTLLFLFGSVYLIKDS